MNILQTVVDKLRPKASGRSEPTNLINIKWISETHGGYHVIVERNDESGKIIYNDIRGMPNVEILKEPMTPIPGVLQGNFEVVEII